MKSWSNIWFISSLTCLLVFPRTPFHPANWMQCRDPNNTQESLCLLCPLLAILLPHPKHPQWCSSFSSEMLYGGNIWYFDALLSTIGIWIFVLHIISSLSNQYCKLARATYGSPIMIQFGSLVCSCSSLFLAWFIFMGFF